MLSPDQLAAYRHEGFLKLPGQVGEASLRRFERGLTRHRFDDGPTPGKTWPEQGARYTLSKNCMADPDLGFIVEHPGIVPVARELLDDDPVLTAFVVYDRTTGGGGLPVHHDYKRWRPVGSSMNWCFAIVPITDFTAESGQLFIAPGSHRLERVRTIGERALHIDPAMRPRDDEFIDPELRRGDLLMMNMHLWHRAAGNQSPQSRIGIFNKYAGRRAPPATGYFLYNDAAHAALSERGKSLLAVHSDKPLSITRALLERTRNGAREFLLVRDGNGLSLPGGNAFQETAIPDWDTGNLIAPLQQHLRERLRIEPPWLTYVGDYEERDALCRVYAYALNDNGFPVPYEPDGQWLTRERIESDATLTQDFVQRAIADWLAPGIVRGKGLSQAQSRIDQFAY
jgi:hypothetical protein